MVAVRLAGQRIGFGLLTTMLLHCSPGRQDRVAAADSTSGSTASAQIAAVTPTSTPSDSVSTTSQATGTVSPAAGTGAPVTHDSSKHASSAGSPTARDSASRSGASGKARPSAAATTPRPQTGASGSSRAGAGAPSDSSRTPVTNSAAAPANSGTPADSQLLTWDAATRTARFQLVAGPFKYDGYNVGGATLTLPPQSNVVINFTNKDGTPHSAVVVDGGGALPNEVSDPVIPGAYTVTPLQGLPQEGKDVMKFKVPATGQYRIACGVPGHALSGMWIWMKVDSSATVATFGPTK